MKKILVLLLCMVSVSVSAQKNKKNKAVQVGSKTCEINGTVIGYEGKLLMWAISNRKTKDTVLITKGRFKYTAKFNEDQVIVFQKIDAKDQGIFGIEEGKFDCTIDFSGPQPKPTINTKVQVDMEAFNSSIMPLVQQRQVLQQQGQAAMASKQGNNDSLMQLFTDNEKGIKNAFEVFMKDPKRAPVSQAFLFLSNCENAPEGSPLMELYNLMPPAAQQHDYSKTALVMLNRATADEVGKIAPDFTLNDSAGKPITLSSYRGKNFVLVDFWATWCGPCRAEFPSLMKAQTEYASKGLVILGVSVDKDYAAWKSMLAKPNFTNWTHIWDGPQGPNQVTATLYSVPSIPRNFLLDKDGKVIARNLRGADVEETLKKFLK
jgi:thiol-disulfide isomerase/thioredoxin